MPQNNPKPGEKYIHFKNKLYQIITVATHSETREPLVIYQALYGDYKTFARPLAMFTSEVDKEKYPTATRQYRFTYVEDWQIGDELQKDSGVKVEQDHGITPTEIPVSYSKTAKTFGEREPIGRVSKRENNGMFAKKTVKEAEPEEGANEYLMEFLDADTFEEKWNVLVSMKDHLSDLVIDSMAASIDVVIEEGHIEDRYEQLKTCVATYKKYETTRLR